jgi:hypothetical protein
MMSMLPRSFLISSVVLALTAAARPLLACPACLSGRNFQYLELGSLLSLVPFGVVAIVLWVLRHERGL